MRDEGLILAVSQAQQGDTRAFDLLVHRFQNMAVAYARTQLPDLAAAEDAAQDAFVQAWHDLPGLKDAAAFGAWLRRLVFKFCDRVRRSERPTVPLDETVPLPDTLGPVLLVERADDAAQVHDAIAALPPALQEVTWLYYWSGHAVKEIAVFLDVPVSSVKNRLHAARKKLRKELWIMAETILEEEKPSHTETFAETVLARVLHEFQQQAAADPQEADRGLLEEGWEALFQLLNAAAPLNEQALHHGFTLLWHKKDWHSLSTLLMRSLRLPRTDSETAWTHLHLTHVLALGGSAAGATLAYENFERWIPRKSPHLSATWPHFPSEEGAAYGKEEVRLLALGTLIDAPRSFWNQNVWHNSETVAHIKTFLKAWYTRDALAKIDAPLSEIAETSRNRRLRFWVLQKAANAIVSTEDLDSTARYIQLMHGVAERAEDASERSELTAKALGQEIHLAQRRGDEGLFTERLGEMLALLEMATGNDQNTRWVREQRQALARVLMRRQRHDLALPLWDANAASGGQINGYGGISYAATLWILTGDRERTLQQLREACAQETRRQDLLPMFTHFAEFADVRDDPQFLEAIGKK